MVHEPTIPMRAPCPVWHKVVRHRIDQVVENPRVRDLLREWDRLRGPRRRAPLSMFHGGFWPEMLDRLVVYCAAGFRATAKAKTAKGGH